MVHKFLPSLWKGIFKVYIKHSVHCLQRLSTIFPYSWKWTLLLALCLWWRFRSGCRNIFRVQLGTQYRSECWKSYVASYQIAVLDLCCRVRNCDGVIGENGSGDLERFSGDSWILYEVRKVHGRWWLRLCSFWERQRCHTSWRHRRRGAAISLRYPCEGYLLNFIIWIILYFGIYSNFSMKNEYQTVREWIE